MKTPYKVYDIHTAFELFKTGEPLFSDCETMGLYGQVRLLQAYQPHLDHVVMVDTPDPMLLAMYLGKHDTVWHNSHYDLTTIQQQTSTRWIPDKFDDTFLLARLHFADKEKFSLDQTFEYVLGYCPYTKQNLDKKSLQKSDWSKLTLTEDQRLYAATDVFYMPQLWEQVKARIDDTSYKLDMLTLRYCLDFQWNGMPLNKDKLYFRHQDNEQIIKQINLPINANSYVQVRKWLGGITESDALALLKLSIDGNTKAHQIVEVRRLRKQNSFLDKFDTTDGRIYGKFLPSARSGRLTSKDQNLQQLPRKLKDMFEAPDGRVLIYADYAQVELRTICAITACKAMEELFRSGADLHGFTAQMIFGDDWNKSQRNLSKTYNFSFLYGGGISMLINILVLQAEILLTEEQAVRDRRRWRNLWKEIYAWQEVGINKWRQGRLGSTALGRKYKAKMMTDQLNIENQGTAAEVFKLALHYFYPAMKAYNKEHDVDFMLCNAIHDSFIVEGPDEPVHYKAIAKLKADSMQKAWFEMSKLLTIKDLPMPVDVAVGKNWGDIENDDVADIWNYNLEGMTHAGI
tara:strand:+ start:1437 stop:3152 length:1716 start_codon:yes stop_codon:yes gene_type:complete